MMKNLKRKETEKRTNLNKKIFDLFVKADIKKIFLIVIIYNIMGVIANCITPFPLYGYFIVIFNFIAISSILAIRFFSNQINLILIEISGESKFRTAKYAYSKFQNNKIVFIIPFFVIIIYGGIGILLMESFKLNYSMIFALAVFIPTVYLSILVYMQYIVLAIFLYKASICNEKHLSHVEQRLADRKILGLLSELVNIYRNSFFAIGTAYIIAFGLFTLSNAFGIDISVHNFYLVIGWGIITIAIVIVFPVISILEKKWMLRIQEVA